MTAVAGDFYEFLSVDEHRIGFLIADVSGHGVSAALIASMIKVAVQSVAAHAANPAELLRQLRGVLSADLRGQSYPPRTCGLTPKLLLPSTPQPVIHHSYIGTPPIAHSNV